MHGEMDPLETTPGDGQIVGLGCSRGQEYRVVIGDKLLGIDEVGRLTVADIGVGDEFHTFFAEQIQTSLDDTFVQLHIRNAVHQQTANPVGPLVDGDLVTGFVQLSGSGQTGRSRTDDGYFFSGANGGRSRLDPTFEKRRDRQSRSRCF